ncbi:hypothetical protein Q8A73_012793 [Channa argus]|nr:hypothetical protein Q8A73_012793 [Channa argus]
MLTTLASSQRSNGRLQFRGPTVGALVGVAGAVGVSLAAAMAATENFKKVVGHCGGVGRLGVTVGAAAGAFLSSCVHSGLSETFVAEDNRAMSTGRGEPRNPQLPSCFSTDLASVIATFCIGMVLGALGGLLLGTTAVVLIQSLELLDKNTMLVDQLLNYTIVKGSHLGAAAKQRTSQSTCSDLNLNFGISLLVGVFGPTVGALVGVAGAVGVSLAAAMAATENFKKVVGHCGGRTVRDICGSVCSCYTCWTLS